MNHTTAVKQFKYQFQASNTQRSTAAGPENIATTDSWSLAFHTVSAKYGKPYTAMRFASRDILLAGGRSGLCLEAPRLGVERL
ncbi:MAG: hypothetical protein JOY62_18730 [Acidobacteriaceae bacterium]|nr:hypothetical protein [Acidobacteriaceae bacterium]MBV9782004.1 hypothetical protein [Acidobacteriaceae bacterium]